MKDDSKFESGIPVSRRNVLKAGAVSAVGVGLFSSVASATNAQRIEFCDCSQVCLDREGTSGAFRVVEAWEENGGWSFAEPIVYKNGEGGGCYDVEGTEKRIIGIVPYVNPDDLIYCNPYGCAQDALDVYLEENGLTCQNEVDGEPAFGTFEDIKETDDNEVEIVGCCVECESEEGELLVKYEWEGGRFTVEEGSDDNITLESVKLDEDGEPKEACFSTTYCDLFAVVKASNRYEVTSVGNDEVDGVEFCVEGIEKDQGDGQYAISNIQFFCEEPGEDDYVLGNSNKGGENGNNGNNDKAQGPKK